MCAWPTFIYSSSEFNFLQKFYFMAITSSQSMPFRLLRELAQHIIPGRYLCRHSWDTSIRVHDKLSLHSLSQHTVKLWPINLVVSFPPISYGDRDPSLQLLLPKAPLSLSSSTGGIFRQEDHKRCQVIYNLLQIMVHNNVHKYPQRLAASTCTRDVLQDGTTIITACLLSCSRIRSSSSASPGYMRR